ncbi:hypothetical protein G9G63_09390 [Paenibacillus sp. EKM202P]|uniref:hypothetical protein n=1 Tax=unclassified Paenibacillus TaxID=185978 RepID=UPI0013EB1047|nr:MULTISPECIES: hypothetical protein [unclassified Paenibacillus]KAF6565362.1 hypothetical protein G9G63_09390 [Paenibacillus sp. EKM202P]KAF6569313.1 hypothetical protein G9G64_12705 [Paenibacillus sp. EKM207P]
MRKVEIKGYIIFDEEELQHGNDIVGQIGHELFNVDGVVEWELEETNNAKINYEREE